MFAKGLLRVARPVQLPGHLCSCVPALLGPAAGPAQSQRHEHLSIYTELTRVLPLLPLPAPAQRECHRPCLRKAPGNTNRHLLPNKALQSSFFLRHCTTMPTCRQEGCAVPSPHTMDTMEHSLDRPVLPAHTCCHLRWQQQRLSCALMRSIGLKSEKMLLKPKNPQKWTGFASSSPQTAVTSPYSNRMERA